MGFFSNFSPKNIFSNPISILTGGLSNPSPQNILSGGILGSGGAQGAGNTNPTAMPAPYQINWNEAPTIQPYIGGQKQFMQEELQGIRPDFTAANQIKAEGMAPSQSSQWLQMAKAQQGLEKSRAMDQAAAQAAGQAATQRSAMAMQGGLTRGAAERSNKLASRNALSMQQDIAGQYGVANAGLARQAEENRLRMLQAAPGAYNTAAQVGLERGRLIGQANLADTSGQNAWNMQKYGYDADLWGRKQLAGLEQGRPEPYDYTSPGGAIDFIKNPVKGVRNVAGSFICTELRRRGLITAEEAAAMFAFLMRNILKGSRFYLWYLEHSPEAIKKLNELPTDWEYLKIKFVDDILRTIENYGDREAARLYMLSASALYRKVINCGPTPLSLGTIWDYLNVTKLVLKKRFWQLLLLSLKTLPRIGVHV